ncbi:SDR family oxidoreductase [Flammeovirga aprica]|uniref:SDR family oxidoreductase n=1 Tax=Flammeovirga aprica JL-4 TaxID=694437 RepID=A0A7X9RYI2_9BACT|nr:SDR family oxidoreductase [Flammeovirga aprica]NME70987.1 SDR family oxidoreductase [Flammeovirga aprica JL-4]
MNILITGSSSGFGKLTTETLLVEGYTVFATMIGVATFSKKAKEELQTFAQNTKGHLHIMELDVTNQDSINNAINEIYNIVDQIDVLINNAGIGGTGWTEAFPESQFTKIFDVNVFGVQRMMRAVLPQMRKRKEGLIINLSSIQGRVVFPYSGIYTATKFAVEGLTESYHYELSQFGIDVVMVQPGGFKTNFESVQSGPHDQERLESYGELINAPDEVWGAPDEDKDFLPHPQPVPDAIVQLIEMPNGKRPIRTTVDPLLNSLGTAAINETALKAQQDLATHLEWKVTV